MKTHHTWGFALFSANLHRFMPSIPWAEHAPLYRRYSEYHRPKPIQPTAVWDIGAMQSYKDQASILCLYHLGYHAHIPRVLADGGLRFDIILDRKVYEARKEELDHMQQQMQAKGEIYRFLFSDHPAVLLQARSALRQGRHLLVFADGNSGTGDELKDKVQVDFLDSHIYVRQGIGLLSYITGRSVIPLLHDLEGERMQLRIAEPIKRATKESRGQYIGRAMQTVYHHLGRYVSSRPWEWEAWAYLHELNCFPPSRDADLYDSTGSDEALVLLRLAGKLGYFDRSRYCFIATNSVLRK